MVWIARKMRVRVRVCKILVIPTKALFMSKK